MRKILLFLCVCANLFALPQDPSIVSGTLENGLKYYVKQNALPKKSAEFQLIINSGSTDEALSERGLAHFVEHMAFNGSRDFSKNDLIKQLEALGVSFGADLNAHTSYDETAYKLSISVSEQNLKDVFKVFSNWIDGVKFDPEELDKERGVIIEEERARNTPMYRLYQKQAKELFAGSIYLDRAPIGDMAVVKSVSAPEIKAFYDRLYQPRFMSFVAVGDFNATQIEALIKQNFSSAKNTNSYAHPSKAIPPQDGLNVYNYDANETGTNLIRISFFDKFYPRANEANARKIWLNLYIANLMARLYEQKTQNENSLLRMGYMSPALQSQKTMHNFESMVTDGKFNEALKDMLSVIKGVSELGFNQSDFLDVKSAFINSVNTGFEQSKTKKSKTYMNEIVYAISSGSVILSEEASKELDLKLLNEITLDEINGEFRRILALTDKRVSVFSTNGYAISEPKFLEFQKSVKAYEDHKKEQNLPKTLLASDPQPRAIVSKIYDKKHDLYVYKLENNATAVLKPLKTRKDVINFAAVSKGGTSNLSEPKLGKFSVELSNESGAGEFNNYQILKILSGKQISYQKTIDPLTQGFSGSSTPADIKYLFEAINLEFNAPRTDAKILDKIRAKTLDNLAKKQNLPEYKFNNEFVKFFYGDNARMKPLEASDVNALNFGELTKIVNEKFTNAASYVFIFAGDFEIARMEELLKKYVASLPSRANAENFTDDGVRSIKGKHEFKRNYQVVDRSDVSINMINENVKYSRENSLKAQALSAVLRTALREKIREDMGEVYGISLGVSVARYPYEHSTANIYFTCSPKNTDAIIAQIRATIAEVKQKGALDAKHLQNYKKAAILSIEKSSDQPSFWLQNIVSHYMFGNELFDLDEYKKIIQNISNDDIKSAAKLYLDDKNEIISVNNPAKK